MLDTHSTDDAAAKLAETRTRVAETASALRDRMQPDRLLSEGARGLADATGRVVRGGARLVRSNPVAVAVAAAGLAWLAFGRRRAPSTDPHFEAVSRWEDEGGPAHPAHPAAADEVPPIGADPDILTRAATAVRDYPLPLGLAAAAIGGVVAAMLTPSLAEFAQADGSRDRAGT